MGANATAKIDSAARIYDGIPIKMSEEKKNHYLNTFIYNLNKNYNGIQISDLNDSTKWIHMKNGYVFTVNYNRIPRPPHSDICMCGKTNLTYNHYLISTDEKKIIILGSQCIKRFISDNNTLVCTGCRKKHYNSDDKLLRCNNCIKLSEPMFKIKKYLSEFAEYSFKQDELERRVV